MKAQKNVSETITTNDSKDPCARYYAKKKKKVSFLCFNDFPIKYIFKKNFKNILPQKSVSFIL